MALLAILSAAPVLARAEAASAQTFTSVATATDQGQLTPTPGIPALSRDCGLTTKLSDGNILWVFCDSFYLSNTGTLHAVLYNGAAFASPSAPATPRDHVFTKQGENLLNADAAQPGGRHFITLPATATFACDGGVRKAWPMGVAAVANGAPAGGDRVLVFYNRICDRTQTQGTHAYTFNGTGLAAYDYALGSFNASTGMTAPITATVLNDTLFPAATPWGSAAFISPDGQWLHVYRCGATQCFAGRVAPSQAATASSYRWWNGSTWTTSAVRMTMPDDSIPNAQFTVQWMPQLNKYVMVYTACTGNCVQTFNDQVHLRTASSPQGPWSAPVVVQLPNCAEETFPCNAAAGHVEQSGAALTISYSRRNEGDLPTGRLHTATLPMSLLDPLKLDSTTPVLTNQTSATFTFSKSGSSFECSLDGLAFTPCTSPKTVTGLRSAWHTMSVRSVNLLGQKSLPSRRTWNVDSIAPTAGIASGPAGTTTATSAAFTFSGTDTQTGASSLRFECALDGAAPVACMSPYTVSGLLPTSHTMSIRSIDAAGNRSTAATRTWAVALTLTNATPPGATLSTPYSFAFSANAPAEALTYAVTGGTLPAGLTLSPAGVLSGTPTGVGTASGVTVTATSPYGSASQTFDLSTIALISGTVRNAVTNAPATGIRVRVFNASGAIVTEMTTGSDGVFRFGNLRDGSYRLEYADPTGGYVLQYGNDTTTLASAPTVTVTAGTTATVSQALKPLTIITGRITDKVTGLPIAGARVNAYNAAGTSVGLATTAADGTYRFPSLKVDTYRLFMTDPSGAHVPLYYANATTLAAATTIPVSGGTVTADLALEPYTTFAGTVTDKNTGAPLSGIWVTMYDAAGTSKLMAITAADGTYRIQNLRMGDYRLTYADNTGARARVFWQGATTLDTATVISAQGGTLALNITM